MKGPCLANVSSKTYLAALAALDLLGDLLVDGSGEWFSRLASLPDQIAGYLAGWESHVVRPSVELESVEHLFLVGRGLSLSSARTGALNLKESTRVPAEGMSGGAFHHGPFEMVSKRGMVVVFEGEGPDA